QHAVRISSMNDVSRIHETQTNASGNGRRDLGVGEIDLDGSDLALIVFYGAFELMDRSDLRIELLFGNRVLAVGGLITSEVEVRVFEECLVALVHTFNLYELGLERSRIDHRQHIALFDHLAFAIVDAHQLTINAALDGHRVKRGNGAQGVDVDADVAPLCDGRRDRNSWRWCGRFGGCAGASRFSTLSNYKADNDNEQKKNQHGPCAAVALARSFH